MDEQNADYARLDRPRRMLDLFCCEGGMGAGFQRAGWEVYGLDMAPKFAKRYPGAGFACGDALAALRVLIAGGKIEFTRRDGTSIWLHLARQAVPA